MAKAHQRVFALTAAVIFLLSSVAVTGLVIYQMTQQNKQTPAEEAAQKQQEQQQPQNSSKGKPMDNYQPVASVPELQKIDQVEGTGAVVQLNDTVTVHYTLALAKDGLIIETSKDSGQPIPLSLAKGAVIEGWVEGVPGMKVGGKRRLMVPAALGYGETGAPEGGIPPNSDLVFDIEVVDTVPASEAQGQAPQQ